ncbi:MAG: hypothetical protein Q7S92_06865 [Candidatus Diapherotrites archaeon]|nr:hypothetical protein [Candidatus Diapherotrites archaeon]
MVRIQRPKRRLKQRQPRSRPLARFRHLQEYNKVHGAEILRKVFERLSLQARKRIAVSPAVYVKPVKFESELCARLETFAQKCPQAERIFVRGNIVSSTHKNRPEKWNIAPRGHFDPKTGELLWDTPPYSNRESWAETEWLIYPTRGKMKINQDGVVEVRKMGGNTIVVDIHSAGLLDLELRREGPVFLDFAKNKVDGNAPQNFAAVQELIVRIMRQRELARMSHGNTLKLRYVTWRDQPEKMEFYDCLLT